MIADIFNNVGGVSLPAERSSSPDRQERHNKQALARRRLPMHVPPAVDDVDLEIRILLKKLAVICAPPASDRRSVDRAYSKLCGVLGIAA